MNFSELMRKAGVTKVSEETENEKTTKKKNTKERKIIGGKIHRTQILCSVCTSLLLVFSLTACGSTGEKELDDNIYAQISTIEGNSLTFNLVEQPAFIQGDTSGMAGQRDMKPQDIPEGQEPSGQPPADFQSRSEDENSHPDRKAPDGSQPEDGNTEGARAQMPPAELQLTGETKIAEVTDKTIITINGETAALSDLTTGEYVIITLEDNNLTSITTFFGGSRDKMQFQQN